MEQEASLPRQQHRMDDAQDRVGGVGLGRLDDTAPPLQEVEFRAAVGPHDGPTVALTGHFHLIVGVGLTRVDQLDVEVEERCGVVADEPFEPAGEYLGILLGRACQPDGHAPHVHRYGVAGHLMAICWRAANHHPRSAAQTRHGRDVDPEAGS